MISRSIMSDNKKYYYLKLKENHFESDEMVVLESMPDGYKYSNILLKLYLRSLKNGGKLMFNDRIPFNSTMLSTITRHSVGDIEKAVKIFEELGLVEILDNGAIYMNEIQNFIGKGSTEAERKALYRAKIDEEKKSLGQSPTDCPDICPPEKELDLELNKQPIPSKIEKFDDKLVITYPRYSTTVGPASKSKKKPSKGENPPSLVGKSNNN